MRQERLWRQRTRETRRKMKKELITKLCDMIPLSSSSLPLTPTGNREEGERASVQSGDD
jgi:hypothetical protein